MRANQGRFQYTGQMWLPEVGLYHYKARTYSPGIGRFLQADPIGYAGGMNLYAYAGNDPVNSTDPWGLDSWECRIEDGKEICTFKKSTGGGSVGLMYSDLQFLLDAGWGNDLFSAFPAERIDISGGGTGGENSSDDEPPEWFKKHQKKQREKACRRAQSRLNGARRTRNVIAGAGTVGVVTLIGGTGGSGSVIVLMGASFGVGAWTQNAQIAVDEAKAERDELCAG